MSLILEIFISYMYILFFYFHKEIYKQPGIVFIKFILLTLRHPYNKCALSVGINNKPRFGNFSEGFEIKSLSIQVKG